MPEPDRLSPADEADLAALADGRLDPARRDEVLARVAADPRLTEALERQRAAVAALATAASQVSAPVALRARVAELQQAKPAGDRFARRHRAPRRRRAGWRAGIPAGLVVAACAALALVLVLGRGGATVDSVLAVASRPPVTVAAIGVPPGPLLDEQLEGVRFPNYAAKFGWQAVGVREDEVAGRLTRTVIYERAGRRIAYTVVTGDALRRPSDGRPARRDGVALLAFRRDGRTVVTWSRQAHTCVLSGIGVSEAALLELASWKGRGQVRF